MERKRAGARTGKSEATTSDRSPEPLQLSLRVTIVRPPAGVQFCIQGRNRDELVGRAVSAGDDLSFDLDIRVAHGKSGPPRFLGPFTHGTPEERFLYVCVGTLAGQPDSCWTRRAKVPLSVITRKLIEQARRTVAARLEARLWGAAKDGGPVCASVTLLDGGWRLIR